MDKLTKILYEAISDPFSWAQSFTNLIFLIVITSSSGFDVQ